jgi:hypothetical protein
MVAIIHAPSGLVPKTPMGHANGRARRGGTGRHDKNQQKQYHSSHPNSWGLRICPIQADTTLKLEIDFKSTAKYSRAPSFARMVLARTLMIASWQDGQFQRSATRLD